ncbi:MAG TPA: hypothetical protein PJ983_07815 [Flavobacteriales bacterium]|nr:hypothetical protein [Flavobacteriales bacterium]
MIHSILADKATRLYIFLGTFFVANALIAELIGVKLFQLETALGLSMADFTLLGQDHLSFVLSVGVLPWPIVFIMTDVVNDYYGVRGVRFLSLITAGRSRSSRGVRSCSAGCDRCSSDLRPRRSPSASAG